MLNQSSLKPPSSANLTQGSPTEDNKSESNRVADKAASVIDKFPKLTLNIVFDILAAMRTKLHTQVLFNTKAKKPREMGNCHLIHNLKINFPSIISVIIRRDCANMAATK